MQARWTSGGRYRVGLGILLVIVSLTWSAPVGRGVAAAAGPPGGQLEVGGPAALTASTSHADLGAQGLAPVRVGMQYIISDAALLIADERGFMREMGIDFQGMRMDNIELQTALASGQMDAGGVGPTAAVLNAFLRGVRLRMVADRGQVTPGHSYLALVVRKDLIDSGQVRDLADLRGRRVSPQPPTFGTPSWYLLSKLLERGGLGENDVDLVPLAFADQNAGLAGRTIDATWNVEPGPTLAVDNGLGVWFRGGDEAIGPFNLAFLAYSESFANQTDLARRFMTAFLRGVRVYLDAFTRNQGRAETVGILTRHLALKDPALYDRIRAPYMDPNGAVNLRAYGEVQEYFIRHGVQPQPVDLAQMFDSSFAEYAAAQLGPYR